MPSAGATREDFSETAWMGAIAAAHVLIATTFVHLLKEDDTFREGVRFPKERSLT
jgi:hypothetical protein